MDLNYIMGREQVELHRAITSPSRGARAAHRAFAKAYGVLLDATSFPHRALTIEPLAKAISIGPEVNEAAAAVLGGKPKHTATREDSWLTPTNTARPLAPGC